MIDKKDFFSSEKVEKKITIKERKKFIEKFSKPISAALITAMISTTFAKNNIDISKLPKYASADCKKDGFISICIDKGRDLNSHYDTDYYERYNKEVPNVENTNLRGIEHLNIVNGKLILQGYKYDLVSAQEIIPDENILKKYDLDEVIIRINGTVTKDYSKFLKLNFSRDGKKGIFGYHMEKSLTLVYVSYLDKIKVLGIIDNYAGFIETTPRDYEISSSIDIKRKTYYYISQLLGCKHNCKYKKDFNGDIYFYSNGKPVGMLQDMGDEKFILKNNRRIGNLIQKGKKVILSDKKGRVIYRFSGLKNVDIKIPEINADIKLQLNN